MTDNADTQKTDAVLERAAGLGREFLAGLAERPVGPPVPVETLRRTLGGPLRDAGEDPRVVKIVTNLFQFRRQFVIHWP